MGEEGGQGEQDQFFSSYRSVVVGSSVGDVSRCDLRKGESGAQTGALVIASG